MTTRRVFGSHGEPGVSAWAEIAPSATEIAIHHSRFGEGGSIAVTSYLDRAAARELARNLNAAADAIDLDEARARNLALALPEATP